MWEKSGIRVAFKFLTKPAVVQHIFGIPSIKVGRSVESAGFCLTYQWSKQQRRRVV